MASDDGSYLTLESPSSRRAWIEIPLPTMQEMLHPSPSSRRAWIEIFLRIACSPRFAVALLAEGVDRNKGNPIRMSLDGGRPPRGGRG